MQPETDMDFIADCDSFRPVLSHLAHELRDPLAPMQSAIDVMKLDPAISDQSSEMLVILERQLKRLMQIIGEFSDQARTNQSASPPEVRANSLNTANPIVTKRQDILVVDDTRMASFTLQRLLETLGQNVRVASNGLSALDAIQKKMPNFVFSDIGMTGMDGCELAKQIRLLPFGDSVRLIAVTGSGDAADKFHSLESGFDDHVVKPITYATLVNILNDGSL